MNHTRPVRAAGIAVSGSVKARRLAMLMAAMAASSQLLPTTAIAQAAAATGTITGRVLNAANGMYLNNARVSVEGTNLQTFTNQYGEYTLNNVPAGSTTIRVTYTGQEPQVATVDVASGSSVSKDVSFNADQSTVADDGTLILNEFTVAADRFRNAQELAINETRAAVNIKNVVSVDQFGDIPSGNVGELVKFLPGVQIDYGSFGGNNQGYADSDASGISVRGFGPEDTAILIDGLPVSNATPGSLTRQVALDQLSINNASRVELIKVPTPDMPSNSIGGQINLITKSAFEYARPSYSGRVFFNINSLNADWGKTTGPVNESTYKISPGVEFSVTHPFSSKIGLSFTGSAANEITQSTVGDPTYTYTGNNVNAAGERISLTNPALTRFKAIDVARLNERRSGNLRLDWRPTPSQTIRTNVQYSTYESTEAARELDFRPAMGSANGGWADWGPTYTHGVPNANGTTDMRVTTRDKVGSTRTGQIQYNFKKGGWAIDAAGSLSVSKGDYRDVDNGHYSEIALKLNPGRVNLDNISGGMPSNVTTNWRSNAGTLADTPKDHTDLSNYSFDGTIAKSGEAKSESTVGLYKLDVERDLSFIPFLGDNSLAIKVGARRDQEKTEKSGKGINYREILRPDMSYAVADILDTHYVGISPGFGLPAQQWGSTYKLFELNKTMNMFYVPDEDEETNTRVENYNSWVGQQKSMTETSDAWYAQLSGRFFKNRLSLIGGLRQESRKREGRGPFTDPKWDYIKRADGSLYTNAANPNGVLFSQGNGQVVNGIVITPPSASSRPLFANTPEGIALRQALTNEGIWFPTTPYGHPTSGIRSLQSRQLQLIANKEVSQKMTGDPSYSLSSAFKVTSKIDLKAAWSRTFGMPKLEDASSGLLTGSNQFTIEEYTESQQEGQNDGAKGRINVANPGLKPSTSDNWDFELSYYTDAGGKLSSAYWTKSVTNQSQTFTAYSGSPVFNEVLPALGLNPADYDGYRLTTSTNSSTKQKTSGWEFEVRQDFGFLGNWGKNIQAFVSYAFTDLADPASPEPVLINAPDGSVITLVPSVKTIARRADKFGGAGLQYSGARFSAQIRGVYRNENEVERQSIGTDNFLRRFEPEETRIDISMNYVLTKRYSLFVSARDVFNAERETIWKDDKGIYPTYAERHEYREFGVVWTAGINGKF